MQLNPEQNIAANHVAGPCLVTATPGSGKTATITARVVNLIKVHNVSPRNILCLTFTNKAANEMKERIVQKLDEEVAAGIWVSTFHSLCLSVLRKYGRLVGLSSGFTIYDDKDQKELLSKITRMHEHENVTSTLIDVMANAINKYREDLDDESWFDGLSDEQVEVLREYLAQCDRSNVVDFSGILYKTWVLLSKHSEVQKSLSDRFQYMLVDEGQDTNKIQYEIIKGLAPHGNVFIVGDYNQSIFLFRGARPENLRNFMNDFPNPVNITLPRNYRSTRQILSAAQNLIRCNSNAKDVELISEKGEGPQVSVTAYRDADEESLRISEGIIHLRHRFGINWNDCAVLYRTNVQSKIFEMTMRRLSIPCRVYGGFSFFDRKEIKTALSYFSFLANPSDTVAFARTIATPARGIGTTTVGRLERFCQTQPLSILEAIERSDHIHMPQNSRSNLQQFKTVTEKYRALLAEKVPLQTVVSGYLTETGLYDYMRRESVKDESWQKRIDNVDEFLTSIADYASQNPRASLSDYLQTIQVFTEQDRDEAADAVTLLTMHSAKGLEFPIVFIVGLEKNIVPHHMALAEFGEEEERRLLYVGLTRAKQSLHLSYCRFRKKFDKRKSVNILHPIEPSPFLPEILNGPPVV